MRERFLSMSPILYVLVQLLASRHQFCTFWHRFGHNFAANLGACREAAKIIHESWLPPQVPKSAKLVPDWVGSDWIPICFPQEYMSCTLPGTIPKHSRPVLSPIRATQFILARIKGMISSPAFVFMMFLAMFAGPNASIRVHLMDSPLGF